MLTQCAVSMADYWVSYWTNQEELRAFYSNQTIMMISHKNNSISDILEFIDDEVNQIDTIKQSDQEALLSTATCMYIHGGIVVGIFSIGILRSISFYTIAMRASQKLHDNMFHGIISV